MALLQTTGTLPSVFMGPRFPPAHKLCSQCFGCSHVCPPTVSCPGGLPHSLGAALLPTEVPSTVPKPLPSWESRGMSKRHCGPGHAVSNCQPCENQQKPTPKISCSPLDPPSSSKETKGVIFNPVAAFLLLSDLRIPCPKVGPRIHSGRLTRLHSTPSCLVALIKATWKNNPGGCADK